MSESHFEAICQFARTLNIEPFAAGLAQFSHDNNFSEESLLAVEGVFRHMAKLKNELFKFKLTYSKICGTCGNVEAVDNYLRGVEKKIKLLSYKKNHGLSTLG